MPDEDKKSPSQVQVDLDTSGPEVDVSLEDTKTEEAVDAAPENTEQETVKEVVQETKEDKKLEEYSTGVQSRIQSWISRLSTALL